MANSNTFTRIADIAGLIGGLLVLSGFAIGILFPNNEYMSAPLFGVGALLLISHIVGLMRRRNGRPGWLSLLSLRLTLVGLGIIAVYALVDTLNRMGVVSADTDGYWIALIVAFLLAVLALSVYCITASIALILAARG